MKIVIDFPSRSESDVLSLRKNGKKTRVSRMEITPHFYRAKEKPIIAHLEVRAGEGDSQVVKKVILKISGTNGNLELVDRSSPVLSVLDAALTKANISPAVIEEAKAAVLAGLPTLSAIIEEDEDDDDDDDDGSVVEPQDDEDEDDEEEE